MGKHADTELERIEYGQTGFARVMTRNMNLLNDTLLKVQSMLDVDITSLGDNDVLAWNATSEKFENIPWETAFPTTTTTTTTV